MSYNSFEQKWTKIYPNNQTNLKLVLQVLAKSREGRRLLKAAQNKREIRDLSSVIKVGDHSLTDTTLIRKFSRSNPADIEYESISKIYLDRELSLKNAVLDLAHELTHFLYRKPFNPYKNDYKLDDFIHSTIEGEGGEIQAFVGECLVSFELFGVSSQRLCQKISSKDGKPSFEKAALEFYKVGRHYDNLIKRLQRHAPHSTTKQKISNKYSTFISSAYGEPYPVAAYNEYFGVMRKVCENDQKRLGYIRESQSRSPASVRSSELVTMEKRFKSRCAHIL